MTKRYYLWIRELARMVLFGCLVSTVAAAGTCAERVVIPLDLRRGFLIAREIFVNGHGPLDFLVDTGAQSSAVDPGIAFRAGIRPSYRVELVTAAGIALAPAAPAVAMSAAHDSGLAAIGSVELLLQPMAATRSAVPGVDGVLGMNALLSAPFLLDLERRQLVLCPEASELEEATAEGILRDGRLLVDVLLPEVDAAPLRLALDSGTSGILLFRPPHELTSNVRKTGAARIQTAVGSAIAVTAELRGVQFAGKILAPLVAAFLPSASPRSRQEDGLLPLHTLRLISVDPETGMVKVRVRDAAVSHSMERAAAVSSRRP